MNPALRLRLLAVLTGAALVGVAVVHLKIADTYSGLGKHPLALNDQFYAQAAVAFVLTLALLVRPHALVWLATVGFAVGSLGVLYYSRSNCLPIYGFDGCFQESWDVEGANPARIFEFLTLGLAGLGAALTAPAFLKGLKGRRSATAA